MDGGRRQGDAALLLEWYQAAVRAAAPGPAITRALDALSDGPHQPVRIIALGKAATAMAASSVDWLARRGVEPAGGIVVAPDVTTPPHPTLVATSGDHPVPGARSFHAAAQLDEAVAAVDPRDEVWVLLSGGATSLIAAPEPGVGTRELRELFSLLHASGMDIATMNAVRKRFCRWAGGRLAVALPASRVRTYVVSDVIGDDPAAIASGPCAADVMTASDVRALLVERGLWEQLPLGARRYLECAERDPALETPKPGHPALDRVETSVVASNRVALDGALACAERHGLRARIAGASLSGEASAVGVELARKLLDAGDRQCLVWGGETTVTLGDAGGKGGRCQELALSAARVFSEGGATTRAGGPTLLAAGTDGRDGPTDAAGALVDRTTWDAIRQSGHDPDRALRTHDSYRALDTAGALLRTHPSGTNVMDVVIGLSG